MGNNIMVNTISNINETEYKMYFVPYNKTGSTGECRLACLPAKPYRDANVIPSFRKWNVLALLLVAVLSASLFNPALAQHEVADYRALQEQATAVGIDAERLESLILRAQQRGVSPDQLQGMIGPAITLAENDLPYQSVLQKTLEGMAKRIPAGNIRMVTENIAGGITRSAGIIDPWMARNEVGSMVAAVRGGRETGVMMREFRNTFVEHASYGFQQNMDEQTVREYLDQSLTPNVVERNAIASVAAGLRALPEMPTTQENPATSIRLLVRALDAGFTPGEIQQLPDAFRSAQFHSQLPADRVARGLDHQLRDNIPAAHILENLFQGNVGGGPPGFTPPGLENREGRGSDRGRDRRPVTPPPFQD